MKLVSRQLPFSPMTKQDQVDKLYTQTPFQEYWVVSNIHEASLLVVLSVTKLDQLD